MFKLFELYTSNKKIVVCYRNSGLGDILMQASCGWLYAKNNNRNLFINWTNSIYFKDKSLNAFFVFFEIPDIIDEVTVLKIRKLDILSRIISIHFPSILIFILSDYIAPIFTKNPNNFFRIFKTKIIKYIAFKENNIIFKKSKNSPNLIFFRSCLSNYSTDVRPFFDALKPSTNIANDIDDFYSRMLADKTIIIGAHIRYYNKNLIESQHTKYWIDEEKSFNKIYNLIEKAIEKAGTEDYVIYLSTDSSKVQDLITLRFKNVVSYKKKFGKNQELELHAELPKETAMASISEMFLLAKSNILVRFPPDSWFSHYASLYVKEIIA